MVETKTLDIIELAVSAVLLAAGLAGFLVSRAKKRACPGDKGVTKRIRLFLALWIIAGWFLVGKLITLFSASGGSGLEIEFQIFSERVSVCGVSFARTTVLMWVVIAVVLALAVLFRCLAVPRFQRENPGCFQNAMEALVELMDGFTRGVVGQEAEKLSPYMFSLAVFMIFSAFSELLGQRPPTSDIVVTFAMGVITFALINFYGVKKKGVAGRIKGLAQPTPVVLPMKILSDVAVPVSLACRLFGNMLGGLIVMDLLKSVLGGYGAGIPAVAGLYFNVFHPLIQTYIFIILSLTFINEAME